MSDLSINLNPNKKQKPAVDSLGFGVHFTDHMFVMDYVEGKGWHNASIEAYAPISLDPSAMVFHYGQAVFEGLKAYLSPEGEIIFFRPEKNLERLAHSNERLCIPAINNNFVLECLKKLVTIEKEWIPTKPGTSLYIRPFIIATDPHVGVRPSTSYKLMIILSPVGAYYPEGLNPVKILVESTYVRAVQGGIGAAKTAGNYAASLKAQMEAKKGGYTQVLWLDGLERKYVDEVGTMNVFFKINNEIITPELNGSILDGVTRNSAIQLLKSLGYTVTERKVSIDEIHAAWQNGKLEESFGTGTAAVISPIGEFVWNDTKMVVADGKIGALSQKLYDTISGIQNGKIADTFGWITKA